MRVGKQANLKNRYFSIYFKKHRKKIQFKLGTKSIGTAFNFMVFYSLYFCVIDHCIFINYEYKSIAYKNLLFQMI